MSGKIFRNISFFAVLFLAVHFAVTAIISLGTADSGLDGLWQALSSLVLLASAYGICKFSYRRQAATGAAQGALNQRFAACLVLYVVLVSLAYLMGKFSIKQAGQELQVDFIGGMVNPNHKAKLLEEFVLARQEAATEESASFEQIRSNLERAIKAWKQISNEEQGQQNLELYTEQLKVFKAKHRTSGSKAKAIEGAQKELRNNFSIEGVDFKKAAVQTKLCDQDARLVLLLTLISAIIVLVCFADYHFQVEEYSVQENQEDSPGE